MTASATACTNSVGVMKIMNPAASSTIRNTSAAPKNKAFCQWIYFVSFVPAEKCPMIASGCRVIRISAISSPISVPYSSVEPCLRARAAAYTIARGDHVTARTRFAFSITRGNLRIAERKHGIGRENVS